MRRFQRIRVLNARDMHFNRSLELQVHLPFGKLHLTALRTGPPASERQALGPRSRPSEYQDRGNFRGQRKSTPFAKTL